MMNPSRIDEYRAKLYYMDIKEIEEEICFHRNYERLSAERKAKVDSYYFIRDRKLSLGAGVLLDKGLLEYGLSEAKEPVAYGEKGKPYLPVHPHIHFNIAHSEKMVLVVFADVEVGCDVEIIRQAEMPLAKRFFSPKEYEYVERQEGEEQKSKAFYRIWTVKESFLKATGLGMSLPMDSFEVQIDKAGAVIVSQEVDDRAYHFREFRFGNYCAAVCFQVEKGECFIE